MDYCTPQPSRRHNPVDSICRKLQTIQWRGDREPNSPFQIPKLSSNSYDSPQCGLRHNLEAILKKGTLHRDNREKEKTREMGMPSRAASQHSSFLLTSPSTPTCNRSTPANVTYTITSTLGERRCADGSDLRQVKTWQGYCSTPTGQSKDSPYFTFTRGPQSAQPDSERPSRSPPLSRNFTQSRSTLSYNVNFSSADNTNPAECELPYPALVVKRLSMGDGVASEKGKENMAEISLICEENLLDTIFHACDTQRRGKVYVSHIVDYLRHTTSRSSEDSGLEELCNMLDPEHKDVSIDLDTYHAVMREWIDDCQDDITQESVKLRDSLCARRSMLFNMTSGSLEAFGGEASRVEFETSELVYCVADLQMSNQKLQEEVKKLKQVVESMEESNQKLAEENEELHNQAKINQQLAQKEKMLKEEVEEMKATLSCTEEGRARASAHSKHVERENQSLIAKIASLQEENFKVTMETDELQRRITELCDINADLQVPLLVDKNKLERQMQMILPDLAGLSLSVAYRMNQSSSGSLQTELALAQSPLEVIDYLSSTSFASPLDETLDREVLLMLQGPTPEHMALEFKNLINKLNKCLCTFLGLSNSSLQMAELDARRADWVLSLDQLAQYTDSLEKELIKMAGNMRRSRTEILHLSVRVQEQENQKRQLCEELEQLKTPQDSREASCQTPALEEEVRKQGMGLIMLYFIKFYAINDCRPLLSPFLEKIFIYSLCVAIILLLPVLVEEEETVQDGAAGVPKAEPSTAGKERFTDMRAGTRNEPQPEMAMLFVRASVCNFNHPHSKSSFQGQAGSSAASQPPSLTTKVPLFCFQAEFQRLALGFKCDMFTLEKRLRLEERSRDLAEENVRKEVSSCQGLLQALSPLCDNDNQSMEIIQRLQKNLDILIQSMTRVSSRSEMLGAIHQESRIGKAVEVMIQHVENLRRLYTKEHAELLELRETLMQNERSFGSQTEKGCTLFLLDIQRLLLLLCPYVITLVYRNVAGKITARPPLKRFSRFLLLSLFICIGLLALLASLVMQPAVDAAPVGTGDSWMTIQQLLWPYTGLRYNGQPPV
uniref:Lymphoid-restricted membrane protein n=1 Tax=Pundamilia nyererei TaxID=303518 RepID=A0A3B4FA80_9CICH